MTDTTVATEPAERAPGAVVLLAAALAGAAVMAVELSAVRLVAPWFGSSLSVWTNVLGVVLTALSLGYLAGARLADGPRPARSLARVAILGAVLVALVPLVADPVCDAFLPDGTALARSGRAVVWGSLAASSILFLPAAAVLGTAGPLAVEAMQRRRGGHAGAAGGLVLCVSTLGSLAGTFAASHLLLPELGVEGAFEAAALVLAGSGALLAASLRARGTAALALVSGVGAAAVGGAAEVGSLATDADRRLVAERDSAYQRVRVVEYTADGRRQLEVDERSDSFQSVWYPEPGLLPAGFYYNDFALPPAWAAAERGAPPERWRVAILGLGGGTAWRVLDGTRAAGTELVGVGIELDPTVVELARAHLDLPPEGGPLEVWSGRDARAGLRALDGPFDQVVLDTYANQVEIPPHLCTVEFMGEVRERLAEGGWLTINVGAFGLDDLLVETVGATVAAAFERPVLALQVPRSRNVTLVVRRDAPLPELDAALADPALDRLLGPRRLPGTTRTIEPPAVPPLTDDHSPTPVLQRRSIAAAETRPLPDAELGRRRVAALEGALDGALGSGTSALARARRASQWLEASGDLAGAHGVSRAGLELAPDDLELRLRAAATALALLRPGPAADQLDALEAGLDSATGLAPQTAAWFRDRLAENRAWLEEQRGAERSAHGARRRARLTVLAAGGLALALGLALAWSGGQRRRAGDQP